MSKRKEIDNYIAAAAPFAQPILSHLRDLIHQVCPETEEKLKWGFPHFDYKGVYVSMASFKEHCAFNFWKASLMKDPEGLWAAVEEKAMGHFGKIRSLVDLPTDEVLLAYLLEAKQLNDQGVKRETKKPTEAEKKVLETPADLLEKLKENPAALKHFEAFSYSHRKEYIQWINEAKTEPTRMKRITTTVEWVSEGKQRSWKYQ
jgi:uncharacterized protein YdeI (YjbR/CyaY-like superfamily)